MAGPLPQTHQYIPVPVQVEHVEEGSISIPATGKSSAGYTIYQVAFKTKTPTPQGRLAIVECNVWKRFSDFQHLEKELEQIHATSNVDVKFPSLVKASYFGRFKDTVVEDRRASAEALLYFAVHSQHLRHSPPLLDFLKAATIPVQPLLMAGNSDAEPPPPDYNESESEANTRQLPTDVREHRAGSISQEELDLLMGNPTSDSTDPTHHWTGDSTQHQGGGNHGSTHARGHSPSVQRSTAGAVQTVVEDKKTHGEGEEGADELDELGLTEWTLGHTEQWNMPTTTPSPSVETAAMPAPVSSHPAPISSQPAPVSSKPAPVSSQPEPVSSQPAPVSSKPAPVSSQPVPAASSQPVPVETDWWSQALAATQEISDDFDMLVEESEQKCVGLPDGKMVHGGQSVPGSLARNEITNGTVDPDQINNGTPGTEEASASVTKATDTMGLLAPAKVPSRASSTDSINSQGGKPQASSSNSRSPSPPQREANPRLKDKNAYVIQASKLITRALQYEQQGDYQEAFDLLKAGVDLLLNGVQTDKNKKRRDLVRTRTAQYLQHAEELHQKHISPKTPALAKVPSTPNVEAAMTPHHLKDFKVINTIGKVMVVESCHTHLTYVIKVIHRTSPPSVRGLSMKSRMTVPCPHMVKLLHQYDSANRSFLLLEHIKGGKLIDFVTAKRKQRVALEEGPSEKLIDVALSAPPTNAREHTPTDEQLLEELNALSPPKSTPWETAPNVSSFPEGSMLTPEPLDPTENKSCRDGKVEEEKKEEEEEVTEAGSSEPTESLDRLSDLRKQLEGLDDVGGANGSEEVSDTIVSVIPPTPLDEEKPSMALEEEEEVITVGAGLQAEGVTVGAGLHTKTQSSSSLHFTPANLRGSPDRCTVDDWVQKMESSVREWAAKVVVALEHLHAYGIVCRDLNLSNLLLDNNGNVKLTYFGSWEGVDFQENSVLRENLYMAPELSGCQEVTSAADWWSLGAILFELLTGQTLVSCHPDGVHSHLPLHLPVSLSSEATALLHELLQVSPSERIGAGSSGVEELKAHPFFSSIDWTNI